MPVTLSSAATWMSTDTQPDAPVTTPSRRPFYAEYAWAFDLLVDRPVARECGAIVSWLVERGVVPGANLLDAGCGTGRYAAELARRGYLVEGIDRSPELIRTVPF
jgi:2-polyprenyl-3-methyl-5-hydroxy-6-metoxy-1,4-benzoquinol methylase